MATINANPKVDEYIKNAPQWQDELTALRQILLSFDMHEDIKWAKPTYLYNKHIVVVVIPFKESCALLFFKGD